MNRILLIFEALWQPKKILLQFFTHTISSTLEYPRLITFLSSSKTLLNYFKTSISLFFLSYIFHH